MKKLLFLFISGLLLIWGCTKPPQPVYDQPVISDTGYYEMAWVEPNIIFTDTLVTLIRAERLDSFYVNNPAPMNSPIVTLSFQVTYQPCYTRVRLIDPNGEEALRLFEGTLGSGFYKFSCNRSKINQPGIQVRNLFLKADICGTVLIEPLHP